MTGNLALGLNFNTDIFPFGFDTSALSFGNMSMPFYGFNSSIFNSAFDVNPYDNFNMNLFMASSPSLFYNMNTRFGSLTSTRHSRENQLSDNDYSLATATPKEAVERAKGEMGQVGGYKYGESGKWCAAFASWAYGGKKAPWGDEHAVADIKKWAENNGVYAQGTDTSGMKAGDLVVWRPETCNGKSHVGIISQVNGDGTFQTVEGNSGNKVKTHTYSSKSNFDGYVSMAAYNNKAA